MGESGLRFNRRPVFDLIGVIRSHTQNAFSISKSKSVSVNAEFADARSANDALDDRESGTYWSRQTSHQYKCPGCCVKPAARYKRRYRMANCRRVIQNVGRIRLSEWLKGP